MDSPSNARPQNHLKQTLKPLRGHLAAATGFSALVNLLMIVPAIYMLQVYDRAVGSGSIETLLALTLIMIFLLTSLGLMEWVRGQILQRASFKLDELLSDQVFNSSFDQALYGKGQGSAQAMADLSGLRQFLSSAAPFAFMDAPWVPIYVAIMFLFHPWFGLLATISCLLLILITLINQRLTTPKLEEANEGMMNSRAYAIQNLRNAEVVAAMGMRGRIRDRWKTMNTEATIQQTQASDTSVGFGATSKAFRLIAQSMALGLGAWLAINMEISPGMMIAGAILLGRALAPIDQMIGAWRAAQAAISQTKRLNELFVNHPPADEPMPLPIPFGGLKVESIVLCPPGSNQRVLQGISFTLNPGTSLGVIGPTASGKSSLARALLGIWKPIAGTVRLDNSDITQWDRDALGPHVGYLPQDIELFSGSVAENIARFGEVEPTEIIAAAKMAGVHDMILNLPMGYDTPINPMGTDLSGGQRQRIALARAMFGSPRLVILDEPNSNLDDIGDAALDHALKQLQERGVTVVVISHKTRILQNVNKILVLREGQIAEFDKASLIMDKYQQSVVKMPKRETAHEL